MKNFPVTYDGKTYWISRAVAVAGFIYMSVGEEMETYILANKRGENTPNFQGYWNVPCGYLDFDETTQEACAREIYEETGLSIDPEDLKFDVFSEDLANSQNITIKYYHKIHVAYRSQAPKLNSAHSEEKEVDGLLWIPLKQLDNYRWAFNHQANIKRIYKKHIRPSFKRWFLRLLGICR